MKHRIVFIGYWSIHDSLTTATILPWLRAMQESELVEKVILCTVERDSKQAVTANFSKAFSKVQHHSLYPTETKITLLTKISDFVQFPREIAAQAQQFNATALFAHGAPAGALAYKVWKQTNVPFYVSSFEPHADYMAESGVWNRRGLKYTFQKYWERQQEKYAAGLIPVSEKYRFELIKRGVEACKVMTAPSPMQERSFQYNAPDRESIRSKLGWQNNLLGLYAGKYGGLYYHEEAFEIYAQCFHLLPNFRLIILTPQPKVEVVQQLTGYKISLSKVHITSVPHSEVPSYLSAADFAFATYKPGPSKKALSPVKIGEYWANGLPVLLTEGVGDDSDIIRNEGGGALFNLQQEKSVEQAIRQILEIIKHPEHRHEIPKLAQKYRSPERLQEAYEYFFGTLGREANV